MLEYVEDGLYQGFPRGPGRNENIMNDAGLGRCEVCKV